MKPCMSICLSRWQSIWHGCSKFSVLSRDRSILGFLPKQRILIWFLNNTSKSEKKFSGDLSDREEIVMPYLKALVDFREQVRASARTEKNIGILKASEMYVLNRRPIPILGMWSDTRRNPTRIGCSTRRCCWWNNR